MIISWRERQGLNCVFYHDGRDVDENEMGDEDRHDMEDKSEYGKSGVQLA